MIGLLALLSLGASPTPQSPQLPQPHAILIAPSARAAFALASRVSSKQPPLGLMERFGVELDAPLYAYVVADEVVVELAVHDAKAVDAAMELGLAQKKVKKLSGEHAVEAVFEKSRFFLVREGNALFVTRAGAWPSPAIEAARAATKPAGMPKWIEKAGAPVAWGFARGIDGTERVEGAVFAKERTIEVRVNAALDFATGLLVADFANTPGKSRPLFADKEIVAELTAFVGSSAVANAFEVAELAPSLASSASGRVHAALTKKGALIFAMEPKDGADGAALKKAIAGKLEGVDVRLGAPLGDERAPIEVRVNPRELVAALEARSKTKGRIRPLRQDVLMMKMGGIDDTLARFDDVRTEIVFNAAGVEIKSTIATSPAPGNVAH